MNDRIRDFEPADYEGIVAVHNATLPDFPTSVEDLRHWDETREARIDFKRIVWEEDGKVLGFASCGQMSWMWHPRKHAATLRVHPEHRGRGIGAALHERLLAAMRKADALSLRGEVRENDPASIRFAEARGFVAGMREQESAIDLSAFDPSRHGDELARVAEQDIVIVGYDELAEDPDRGRKLWELDHLAGRDMPSPEPITQPAYEAFCKMLYEHPKFFPEGFMIAVDEGAYVGMSNLWHRNVPGSLATGFTGVLREYRGKGIATALKVRVLATVKALGYEEVLTSNDSTNAGMLGINWRLGFEKRPAWIDYELTFPEAAPDAAAAGPEAGKEEDRP